MSDGTVQPEEVDAPISVVTRPSTIEIEKIKGSRFVADIAPAATARAAESFVGGIREREPSASHHCWAYRIAPGTVRASDDGEPSGTAGPPILRRMESASLWETTIVVTRYYGGTNLGTGGLIRAYGAAAAEAIATASIAEKHRMRSFTVRFPYDLSSVIDRLVATYSGEITRSDYAELVDLTVAVPASTGPAFVNDVRNATSGTVIPQGL